MSTVTKHLYNFLSACGGNWRNTLYISCSDYEHGYLLAADRDSCPIVMDAEQFRNLTGVQIDAAECCGQITETAFESLFAQYLLWHVSSPQERPLRQLCPDTPFMK